MSETPLDTNLLDTNPHPAPAPVAPLTVEEQRLEVALTDGGSPLAAQVLAASAVEERVLAFSAALADAGSLAGLTATVRSAASDLWRAAVDRAQGRVVTGHLDPYDDRPLYWARTAMSAALRRLDSPHLTVAHQRHGLLRLLDRRSRGIERDEDLWPTARPGDVRVMVSGFDPYSLDLSVRHSNPSGATALQLDGVRIPTAHGTACVRAVVLPVNYGDFDQGVVEDAYGPALQPGEERSDLITTISMTGRGRMDVERWAANARGGSPDNLRDQHFGPVARAARWPQPDPNPEWIETTLPHEAMVAAGTGPWPVVLKRGIREWPAGTYPDPTTLVAAPDPSEGSTPAAGTRGGDHSNERQYRANRLRIALGAHDVPGGHLHISALEYPADPAALTDDAFEADRRAVVDQTVALVAAAADAVALRRG